MEQLETLVLVVSDAILRHGVDCTKPEGKQEITTSLLNLLKFTKIPGDHTQIFADELAEMTEFLTLLFQLIGGQLIGMMTAGPHTDLRPLRMAHSCLSCWTDASTLFRKKLLSLPGNLIWTLLTELRALQVAVILNEELSQLAESVLLIISNCVQEPSCHQSLVSQLCPRAVLPFCVNPKTQMRFTAKCILGSLCYLLDPVYLQLMELSNSEAELLQLAFRAAVNNDQHMVTLETEGSRTSYSTLELTQALANLIENKINRAVFAQPHVCENLVNLLCNCSDMEKMAAVEVVQKLLADPGLLQNVDLQLLRELSSSDICARNNTLANKDGTVAAAEKGVEKLPFPDKDMTDLEQIQHSVIEAIKNSHVLNCVSDSDQYSLTHALIYLASYFCERWCGRAHESCRAAANHLLKQNDFLGILRDFITKHFAVAMKKEVPVHQFHPLAITMHCLLLWTYCSCHVRRELGSTGVLLQLVKQIRVIEELPAWEKHHFSLVETMLFILANCAIEHSCWKYLVSKECIGLLLPLCKSWDFRIRLGAKCVLSSLSHCLSPRHTEFLQLTDVEQLGLLKAFREAPYEATRVTKLQSNNASYMYSALELTIVLCGLVRNEANRNIIAASGVLPAILTLLSSGTMLEQEAATELLQALHCSEADLNSHMPANLLQSNIPVEAIERQRLIWHHAAVHRLEPVGEAGHPKGKGQLDAADEKLSLTELEHLVFEAMDAMWCSKNESKETTELSLNTKDIISAFHHLSQFFLTSAEDLCEIAAEHICELLGFLSLTCATVHRLFFELAGKGGEPHNATCLLLIAQCALQWGDHSRWIKEELGSNGFLCELLLQLKLLELSSALTEQFYHFGESALSVLANCVSETSCQNYLLRCGSQMINNIRTFCGAQRFDVSFNAKMIISFLSYVLPSQYADSLELRPEELEILLDSMSTVANLQPGAAPPRGSGEFSITEQFQIFILFIQNEANRLKAALNPVVYAALSNVFLTGTATEQIKACELLWKLSTKPLPLPDLIVGEAKKPKIKPSKEEPLTPEGLVADADICTFIESEFPTLKDVLQDLTRRGTEAVKLAASCVLTALSGSESTVTFTADPSQALMYAEGCCQYGKYAECVKLASFYIDSANDEAKKQKAQLIKGRAQYYQYMRELKLLQSVPLSRREYSVASQSCFQKARRAITSLTLAISSDQGGHNQQDEMLLDFTLLDYIRISKDADLLHCILCHGRKKLRKSHIWPHAVLRSLLSFKCIEPPRTGKIFSTPWRDYGSLLAPGEITFPMLCHDCENLLSASCEQAFMSEFFEKLYDVKNREALSEEKYINYSDKLYRFCLSIVFRGLPITQPSVTSMGNSVDIYKLFSSCRQYLLMKEAGSCSEAMPAVALLVLPTAVPSESQHSSFIEHILHSAGMSIISTRSLTSGKKGVPGKGMFFLGSLGVVSILMSLDPKSPLPVPPESIIQPTGGTYHVHCNARRFQMLPVGVWSELDDIARHYEEKVLQVPTAVAQSSRAQDWIADEFKHLGLLASKQAQSNKQTVIQYLPKEFILKGALEAVESINLPPHHHLLLHTTVQTSGSTEEAATLFLAVGTEAPYSTEQPYIIVQLVAPNYIISLGYFISTSKLTAERPLVGPDVKQLLPVIEEKFKTRVLVDRELPRLLQVKGFLSWQSFLFRISRQAFPVYDTKCAMTQACWYCSGRCDNCMNKTSFDTAPMIGYHDTSTSRRFCNSSCLKYYESGLAVPIQLKFEPSEQTGDHQRVFSLCTSMILPNLEKSRITVSLHLGDGSPEYPARKPYALFQQRQLGEQQKILEFFVSDCFEAADPLPFAAKDERVWTEIGHLRRFEFSKILRFVASHFGHKTLASLLAAVLENPKAFPSTLEMPSFERNFDYLPSGFRISHNKGKVVQLPPNHHILLHSTKEYVSSSEGQAVFLAAEFNGNADLVTPYVVLYKYTQCYTFSAAYALVLADLEPYTPLEGTNLDQDEESNTCTEQLQIGLETAKADLSSLLQKHKVLSINALQHRIHRTSEGPIISSSCDRSSDCWFCCYLSATQQC